MNREEFYNNFAIPSAIIKNKMGIIADETAIKLINLIAQEVKDEYKKGTKEQVKKMFVETTGMGFKIYTEMVLETYDKAVANAVKQYDEILRDRE